MRPGPWLLLCLIAAPARAEDAAHREDRLRTAALNRQAESRTTARDRRLYRSATAAQREYRAARDRYERQLAEWRARVAGCAAGDAC